ncbi:hypothetical protein [Pseudonocardia sp. NPDC049154]|uniref:hypothetical protein n=1 Tax=Pseudonocardia sp. NPDC049154 TaxID=3155501 RepID=UPI0033FF3700
MAAVDTEMGQNFPIDRIRPADVVARALDGLEADRSQVVVDELARTVKGTLTSDPSRYDVLLAG